ncbi:flagellar biosynthesis anti-sigma factor FlgM [Sulfurimonas sp.]
MISRINNSVVGSAYANNTPSSTQKKENVSATATEQNSSSRVEKLKESIGSGEYKVDLSALSKKMADELL